MAISSLWFYNSGATMLYYRFWLYALALIFCSVRTANALVEQVAPTTSASWYTSFAGHVEYGSTVTSACQALVTYRNNLFPTWSPYVLGTPTIFDSTNYNCNITMEGVNVNTYASLASNAVCPTSNPAYSFNPVNGFCERTITANCPLAGTLHSDGFFNVGTVPTGKLLISACVSNCKIELISGYTPAAYSILNGIKYYFGKAKYNHTGQECSPNTSNFLADFVGSLPNQTCAAGQQMISMGGVTKCFNSSGQEVSTNSASAVSAASSLAAARAASSVAAASTYASSAGLSASGVEQAQAVAAALGAAGGTSGSLSNPQDPVMDSFCKENPSSTICIEQDYGNVEATDLGTKNISVAISPVTVGSAGACPAPTAITIHGQTKYMEWTTYCNYATGVKPILLAFAWLSAATMLIAGFRTA